MSDKQSFRSFILERLRVQAAPATPSTVRCGTCTACCRTRGEIAVSEADLAANPGLEITGEWRESSSGRVTSLRRTPEGACVHLGEGGCTQYAARPAVCRRFDCREAASWKIDIADEPVIAAAGRSRVAGDLALPATDAERAAYRAGFNRAAAALAGGSHAGEASLEATVTAGKMLAVLGDNSLRDAVVQFGWKRQGMDRQKLLRLLERQRKQLAKSLRSGEPLDTRPITSWE